MSGTDLPGWATTAVAKPDGPRSGRSGWAAVALLALLPVAVLIIVPAAEQRLAFALCAFALAAGVIATFGIFQRRISALQTRFHLSERWNETIFERSGLALWREDWTAARDAVLTLMKDGVRDMEAYFAARPEEARAIRRAVIVKDVNGYAVARMGAPGKEALTGSLDSILPDTDQTFIQWLVAFERGDAFYRSETHITRPDGSATDTLFTAALPRNMDEFEDILIHDLDITEFKQAQARLAAAELELARAARITTMGALSASIAHEVNSPLAAIISHAEAGLRWLRRAEPDLDEVEAALVNVMEDSKRARSVVERTRAFLSNTPPQTEELDLAETVRGAIALLDRDLRAHGVSIHVDAQDDLPPARADKVNMQQVLINLMVNGCQAMDAVDGPRDLTVTVRRDGPALRVDVRDVGTGIEEAQLNAIFSPFFSTKPNGMGMGLAICRTCVESHGGRLWVTSQPGKGSTFHFTVPAAEEEEAASRITAGPR